MGLSSHVARTVSGSFNFSILPNGDITKANMVAGINKLKMSNINQNYFLK